LCDGGERGHIQVQEDHIHFLEVRDRVGQRAGLVLHDDQPGSTAARMNGRCAL